MFYRVCDANRSAHSAGIMSSTTNKSSKRGSIAIWIAVFVALTAVVLGVSIGRGSKFLTTSSSSQPEQVPAAVVEESVTSDAANPEETDTVAAVKEQSDTVDSGAFEEVAGDEDVVEVPPEVTETVETKEIPSMPKTSWPELVGVDGEAAKATVEKENTDLSQVVVIPADSMVTMDYREDRVRIFVDEEGKVARAPSIG